MLVEMAQAFCVAAHQAVGQRRKYDGSPYYTHPFAVANILRHHTSSETLLAAAYLHDVVEDTQCTIEDVEFIFGEEVAELVLGLTSPSTPSDGNRAARKSIDRDFLWSQSSRTQVIKCADIIHNAGTFPDGQGDYWKREKLLMLEGMHDDVKSRQIWAEAYQACTV